MSDGYSSLVAGLWLAQSLTDRNPASHAIMWVAGLMGVVVIVMVVLEAIDWVRERAANRRAGLIEAEDQPAGLRVRPPQSELRDRYSSEVGSVSREQRANEPARHREASRAEWRESESNGD